jgi:hypothetical protein
MTAAIIGYDVIWLVALVGIVVPAWAVIDAASRPTGAFVAAGSNKGMWIALILVLWFLTGILGLVLSIVYLASIRPRVKAVMR